jgi:hypothetical protein
MDEQTIGELVAAVGHLDAGAIADLIRSSSNAGAFEDADLVAAFIASRAAAGG